MAPPRLTVTTINSYGRQAASFVRAASAVGWRVRAQMRDRIGIVANELCDLPNVTIIEGDLDDRAVIDKLFVDDDGRPVDAAFINTTHWGNEITIGCSLADAAKRHGVSHFVYSSMPDHSRFQHGWEALPFWSPKTVVEDHIRNIGLPATFVYAGIYNNNFTSLDYPLFRMQLLDDGSFEWAAPFDDDQPLPWLDAEHDVGPAVLQIVKDGYSRWAEARLPLAFEMLTPVQVCDSFSRALSRPVRYRRAPIAINCPTPAGYPEHLAILERVLGQAGAPYFSPDVEKDCVSKSLELWEGFRSIEEYAREVFPVEESNNGQVWMYDDDDEDDDDDYDFDDDLDDDGSEYADERSSQSPQDNDSGHMSAEDPMDIEEDKPVPAAPRQTDGPPVASIARPGLVPPFSPAQFELGFGPGATDVLAEKLAHMYPAVHLRQGQMADL